MSEILGSCELEEHIPQGSSRCSSQRRRQNRRRFFLFAVLNLGWADSNVVVKRKESHSLL